jgi:uncharacterized protein YecT (DUF1311 family)
MPGIQLLTAIAITIVAVPTLAPANRQMLTQPPNCSNPQTTLEMNICAGRDYRAADQKLNQIYRQIQANLSRRQKERMTDAQLAWIKFRDANCAYERGQYEGGSLATPTETTCLTRMTQQRVKELESVYATIMNR